MRSKLYSEPGSALPSENALFKLKNMKNKLMILREKFLLRKRSLIETVFDYLKNKFQIEHTRHRSPMNAFIHLLSTLIAYQMKPTKPSFVHSYALPNP